MAKPEGMINDSTLAEITTAAQANTPSSKINTKGEKVQVKQTRKGIE